MRANTRASDGAWVLDTPHARKERDEVYFYSSVRGNKQQPTVRDLHEGLGKLVAQADAQGARAAVARISGSKDVAAKVTSALRHSWGRLQALVCMYSDFLRPPPRPSPNPSLSL